MPIKFDKLQLGVIILLFLLIAAGAWISGYQKGLKNVSNKTAAPTQFPTSAPLSQNACTTDNDCTLFDTSAINTMSLCCNLNRCSDYSKDNVQAVNISWVLSQRANLCSNKHVMCPMIAVMCAKQITEIQRSYQAKCVKNVCKKIYSGQ